MESCGDKMPAPGRTKRHVDHQPSFSSTLLDAIYKSMDDPADGPVTSAAANKHHSHDLHYNSGSYYYKASLAASYRATRAPPRPHATTTSSSSDCSSYGGFSSSEAESSQQQHRRLRPIRTTTTSGHPPAPLPAPAHAPQSKKKNNIRAKLRDLRNKPASPGARLAGFLNAIFNGGNKRTPPSASRGSASCSTASSSSCSRSCLTKTPSTRGQPTKRTVRFMEDSHGGEAPEDRRRVQVGVVDLERMLLHRMEVDSDEDDDESSDASSDLFELDNLDAAAGAAAYRDELPVYETTRVVLNRHAIAHGRSTRVV